MADCTMELIGLFHDIYMMVKSHVIGGNSNLSSAQEKQYESL